MLESFLEREGNEEELSASYGHIFAKKIFVRGKLLVKDSNLVTQAQIDLLKFHIVWAYNLAKENTNYIPNPFVFHHLPRIETLGGEKLNTPEKLVDWMSSLYKKICLI